MDPLWDGLHEAGQAWLELLSLPYFYLAIAMVWWHAGREIALQRKMFHVRLYGALYVTLVRVGAGVAVGLVLSVVSLATGANLTPETLICVWAAMIVLALFKLRYICLAYAAGVLGLLHAVLAGIVPEGDRLGQSLGLGEGPLLDVLLAIQQIDVPGLLLLAGLLHVAEGLLVRLQGAQLAIPLFLEGKRGKPVGAYSLSGVWPIPLLWLVPATGVGGFALPWTPWFGEGSGDAIVWSLMAFPVLIGFSERTETYWPEQKARASGYSLMIYGVVIAGLAAGSVYWAPLATIAAAAALVLHEGLVWIGRFRESGRNPLYAQDGTGVRILAVLPGSPASEMGLAAGETIRKVNGAATRTKEELYAALQRQSAFSKLEVANREGHVKFVQRARYAGEHYQLGLLLAPDEAAEFVAAPAAASLWQQLRDAGARRREGATAALALATAAESDAAVVEQSAGTDDGQAASGAEGATAVDAVNTERTGDGAPEGAGDAEPASEHKVPGSQPQTDPGLPPRRSRR